VARPAAHVAVRRFYTSTGSTAPTNEVPRLLKLFSLRPLASSTPCSPSTIRDRGKRVGQRELARALTAWVHGDAAIASVEAASRVMFGGSLEGVTDDVLQQLAGTVPTVDIPRSELDAGIPLIGSPRAYRVQVQGRRAAADPARRRQREQPQGHGPRAQGHDVQLATATMLVVRSGKKDYCLVRVT